MHKPISVGPLSQEMIAALEGLYHNTHDAEEQARCQIILLSHQGLSSPTIANIVCRSPQGVRLVIHRFQAKGFAALRDNRHRHPGPKRIVTPEWEAKLLEIIEQDPRILGVNRASWTAQLMADYLAQTTGIRVSERRVRYYLHSHGYAPGAAPGQWFTRPGKTLSTRLKGGGRDALQSATG